MCVPPIGADTAAKDMSDGMRTKDEGEKNIPKKEKKKRSKISAIASLIFPGLGQFYNRQIGKGILFFILGVVCAWYIYYFILGIFITLPMIFITIYWAYNVYDAYFSH